MRKISLVSSLALFVAVMTLSGCLFPFWDDEGGGRGRGGGYHDEGHRDGGHRDGGEHEGGERR
jgi:hypothetical protein